MINYTKNYK